MTSNTPPPAPRLASFTVGDWLVEPRACRLSCGDTAVKVRPQLVDLLACLARRSGRIALKDEILAEVWPGQFIAESGLSRCVAELRQVLGDAAQQPRFIETIPKRGYRLVAPVVWLDTAGPVEAAASATATATGGAVLDMNATVPEGVASVAAGRPASRRRRVWAGLAIAGMVAVILGIVMMTRSPATVLGERDTVLLADISNTTGDRVFDGALRLALAVNLEQAPFLRILPQDAIRSALVRAGRSPDERVAGPVALEICRREGAAVLLDGSIAMLGSRYVVGVEALLCGTGESLGRAMREVTGKERVLAGLEEAASQIRRRLGESRDSLRQHDVPLARATTSSLEALQALTLGDVRRDRGRYAEALAHYRQATELDPRFALAWARRGVTARNLDLREEAIPALGRAFELRERVTQPERFVIESLYYRLVAGDLQKAIETNEAWKRMYPGSSAAPNALASLLSDELGLYEAAIAEARQAIRLAPYASAPYSNLVQALVCASRFPDAKKVVAEAASRGLDDSSMHLYLLDLALVENDQDSVARELAWAAADPDVDQIAFRLRAERAAAAGRLGEARRLWQQGLARAGEMASAKQAAAIRLDEAQAEVLLGDPRQARGLVDRALAADRSPRNVVFSAIVLALGGDAAHARPLLEEARRLAAADPAPLKVWLPVAESLVVAREGRPEEAIRILQPATRFEKGSDFGLIPLCVRGLVNASAGRASEAAAAFDEVIRFLPVGSGPWTAFARLGLARALRHTGDGAGALPAYDRFLEAWKGADADAPLLRVARRERAALAQIGQPR